MRREAILLERDGGFGRPGAVWRIARCLTLETLESLRALATWRLKSALRLRRRTANTSRLRSGRSVGGSRLGQSLPNSLPRQWSRALCASMGDQPLQNGASNPLKRNGRTAIFGSKVQPNLAPRDSRPDRTLRAVSAARSSQNSTTCMPRSTSLTARISPNVARIGKGVKLGVEVGPRSVTTSTPSDVERSGFSVAYPTSYTSTSGPSQFRKVNFGSTPASKTKTSQRTCSKASRGTQRADGPCSVKIALLSDWLTSPKRCRIEFAWRGSLNTRTAWPKEAR